MPSPEDIKAFILTRSAELGFVCAGVAPAEAAPHAEVYRQWIAADQHASMAYMAKYARQRCDLRVDWPWARSVLCLAAGYAPSTDSPAPIARYARGKDYHPVLKRLCHTLADELTAMVDGLQTRTCVDTAPLAERDYAAGAGLGWIGNNGCLIHPTAGSYLVLAEIVLGIELPPDEPMAGQCGNCRACMDACPNGAIVAPAVVDARRCNSWATIEHHGTLDGEAMDLCGQVFGCDVCQQACPFNRDVPTGLAELIEPKGISDGVTVAEILGWSANQWDAATRGSAVRRATYDMLLRNAAIAAGRQGDGPQDRLEYLANHGEPIVAAAAKWAMYHMG